MNKYRIKAKAITLFSCLMLSQTVLWAQNVHKISIQKEKLTLKEALKEVEKQTKTSIAYNESQLGADKVISLNLKDATLDTALNRILEGTGFSYRLEGNYVILQPVEAKQQAGKNKQVSGQIVDEADMPMIGVNVMVKGKPGVGTITDFDGNFALEVAEGDVLEVSYVGYATQDVKVLADNVYNLKLKADTEVLDEVVVTALGIKREQKALSYNVQKVGAEDLTAVKSSNLMSSLSGKVAGVNINMSSAGAGGASRVVMRGTKSLGDNNNALYVIDGVPLFNVNDGNLKNGSLSLQPRGEGISDFNPDDIESISVLSGPAAAALYGSEAAAGVIMITTKKGEKGKVKVTYSNNTIFSTPMNMLDFQNTYGNRPGEFSSWGAKGTATNFDPMNFFRTGSNVQNTLSMSTGTDRNQTYLSVSSTNTNGIMPTNDYDRYNFTFRNTTKFLNDKMTLDVGASYIIQKDQNMMAQGRYYNPLVSLYLYPRGEDFSDVQVFEEYDETRGVALQRWKWGTQGMDMQNPYWIAYRNIYGNKKDRYMMNASLSYDILDWLNVTGRVRIDHSASVILTLILS